MRTSIITFKTATSALRAEQILRTRGIDAHPRRLATSLKEKGCTAGLSILTQDIPIVKDLLAREGVAYRAVYEEGTM